MKKIFLVLAILAGASFQTFSQNDHSRVIEGNTDIFHGKWIAEQGNKKYEMILQREVLTVPWGDEPPAYIETVWGKITYFENGKVIRETANNGNEAIVSLVLFPNANHIFFMFFDREKRVHRYFDFIIDENNPTKAIWRFESEKDYIRRGGGKQPDPDIPDGMTWTKVE